MPLHTQTFYDLPSLIAHGDERLANYDAISFDVFDTLLIRRVADPNMIKIPVAQLISDIASNHDIQVTPREVRCLRNEIENQHRAVNGAKHPDHEANYDAFMPELLEKILGKKLAKAVFAQVAKHEIAMETAMIVMREPLVFWIKQLAKAGKRLFLISDIYLPAKYIEQIVASHGLLGCFEAVISSADSFQAKASGAAWPLIESNYKLDKARWLHVGDNPISDGARPFEAGISSLVLHDVGERHRLSLATRYNFYASKRDFWKGRNLLQWTLPLEAENRDRDPLYSDGQGFLGFLLCHFIHRLIERCKDEGITRVYFCSREGWLFKKIWDELAPWFYADVNEGDANADGQSGQAMPDARYLYVSRMALASAACGAKGLTPVNAHVARFPAGNRDFRDICRIFKLDAEALAPHLARYDLTIDDAIGFNSVDYDETAAERFSHVLADAAFQADCMAQTAEANQLFQSYLEQSGFFEEEKVAMVDIGWLGTIQHYLSDAISGRESKPEIHGFMLGAIRMTPYRDTFNNHTEGLIYDAYRSSFYSSMTNTIKPVLEEVCRAPHPTLMAYAKNEDKIEPVFRRTDDEVGQGEIAQSQYYEPLHQGIIDLAKRYGPAVQIYKYNTGELKPWLNFMYLAKVAFPKSAEIRRVRHQAHQDDFAGHSQASKKALKQDQTLWTNCDIALRFNPFIRLKWYIRNAYLFLKH